MPRGARDAGMFDGTTLGKIEVVGPDAAEFLDRIYINALRNVPAGRCRYGILLREDGFVLDDGIIAGWPPTDSTYHHDPAVPPACWR